MVAPRRLYPVRNANIDVPLVHGASRAPSPFRDGAPRTSFGEMAQSMFLHDPEHPLKDPNELLNELGGKLTDPATMNHNCPCCGRTMTWDLFAAHARDCLKRSFKTLPSGLRVFTGATLPDER